MTLLPLKEGTVLRAVADWLLLPGAAVCFFIGQTLNWLTGRGK